ncbi:MAG TPA: ABC transporter ATP-binding protein [Planctomycetota bacterium]|nr:ABC transporter ATP-binding protein [Planctomycetota bacterium]
MAELLSARDLRFAYPGGAGEGPRDVLSGVSLSLSPGELVALVGPNGAGKTTLLKSLSGVLSPQSGSVELEGRPLSGFAPREIARRIAFVGQELAADFSFTVEEVVLLGRAPHLGRLAVESERDYEVARSAMRATGVEGLSARTIDGISGGERQRAFLAMALAQEPKLLILDEPASHLDLTHEIAFFDLLAGLAAGKGLAVLVAGHDLSVAADYASRLAVLAGGRLVADDRPEKVLTAELLRTHWGASAMVIPSPATGRPHVVPVPGKTRK